MAVSESKMAEFKMAAIIKLSQNEWVWKWQKMAEFKMNCHHQVRMNEKFFCENVGTESKIWEEKLTNPIWLEFKMAAIIKLMRWN